MTDCHLQQRSTRCSLNLGVIIHTGQRRINGQMANNYRSFSSPLTSLFLWRLIHKYEVSLPWYLAVKAASINLHSSKHRQHRSETRGGNFKIRAYVGTCQYSTIVQLLFVRWFRSSNSDRQFNIPQIAQWKHWWLSGNPRLFQLFTEVWLHNSSQDASMQYPSEVGRRTTWPHTRRKSHDTLSTLRVAEHGTDRLYFLPLSLVVNEVKK